MNLDLAARLTADREFAALVRPCKRSGFRSRRDHRRGLEADTCIERWRRRPWYERSADVTIPGACPGCADTVAALLVVAESEYGRELEIPF